MDEVMSMNYPNLEVLLQTDLDAKNYFDQLPDYVRSHIHSRAGNVHSFESLQDYAENLTRGDG